MSDLKKRRGGRDSKGRSSNSSSTASRESLLDSSALTLSAEDLKLSASKANSHNGSRHSNGASGTQAKNQRRNRNSPLPQNGSLTSQAGSQSRSHNQPRSKTVSTESLNSDSGKGNGKRHHVAPATKAASKQGNGQSMSHDRVRKIVQEEGRSARNLIAYNVPAVDEALVKPSFTRTAPKSPRKRVLSGVGRDMSPATKRDDSGSVKSAGSRPASSTGSQVTRKTDMRARYWAFLFDNLKRAVDEIYQTCETDESVNECKEVIMILQQCTKDFQSLIKQWSVIKAFEHLEESGQRPASLAWEVRKTSPGKLHLASREPGSPASVTDLPDDVGKTRADKSHNSWADLVKGVMTVSELEAQHHMQQLELRRRVLSPQPPTKEPPSDAVKPLVCMPNGVTAADGAEDVGGWETVRRSRSKTSPPSKGPISSTDTGKFKKPARTAAGDATNKGPKRNGVTNQPPRGKNAKVALSRSLENVGGASYRDAVVNASSEQSAGNAKSKPAAPRMADTQRTAAGHVTHSHSARCHGSRKEGRQPVDHLLKVVIDDSTANDLKLDLHKVVHESEDEEVLAMELEQALGQEDEALTQQEAAIKSAIQEEQSYLLEIEETEREEMPQDYQEELELLWQVEHTENDGLDSMETSASGLEWEMLVSRYEAEAERRKVLGLSWADIDEADSRTPGRGAHMHEKLSSPSRKRSIVESQKRHEERQAKAALLREMFRQEKAEKVKDLTKKVEEVRMFKDKMEEQKREYLEKKLQEAEEKRKKQLKLKVKKAHEEENKANEIAFINTLQEQNKKMDILTKHKDVKARLLDIQEERQRKIGEKAAKEAAVEERRKALDAERSARLAEMQLKRKKREEEIELEKLERDKERTEALKAKEKEHKDRLAEIERQQQVNIEELQKKIEQKQSESTRRHNERLQNIKEKAFIMNILKHSTEDQPEAPKLEPYNTKKMCNVCNIVIPSEVYLQSHLRGPQHQNMLKEKQTPGGTWSKNEIETFNIEHIQDVPGDFVDPKQASSRERSKSLKKRCKKLRHRMQARGNEFEAGLDLRQETVDSQHKAKLNKVIKDVNKFMQGQEKGPWPQNKVSALDRVIGEAVRILDKKEAKDQVAFRICGGLSSFTKLLILLHDENVMHLYPKTCSNVCQALRLACRSCFENCRYFLFSNRSGVIIDLLVSRLTWMVDETNNNADVVESAALSSTADSTTLANLMTSQAVDITIDVVASALIHTLAVILSCLSISNPQSRASDKSAASPRPGLDAFNSRTSDTISYAITVGVVDKLQSLFTNVRGSLDTNNQLFSFLHHSINFLTAITKLTASQRQQDVFNASKTEATELMQTYEDIELAGIMSLLYGMLLHNVPTRGEVSNPPLLSANTLTVTLVGIRLINQLAAMDLRLVQRVLGSEGVSLELRHITSYLIWYCTHHSAGNEELLHEVILCVGYFVVLNSDNQATIQSGQSPSILQQLCSLPFQYFSDPKLVLILYPCLIVSCYQNETNRAILEQELSCDLLANFLEESQLQLQQRQLSAPVSRKVHSGLNQSDGRMSLALRFPERLWSEAKLYFTSAARE